MQHLFYLNDMLVIDTSANRRRSIV